MGSYLIIDTKGEIVYEMSVLLALKVWNVWLNSQKHVLHYICAENCLTKQKRGMEITLSCYKWSCAGHKSHHYNKNTGNVF